MFRRYRDARGDSADGAAFDAAAPAEPEAQLGRWCAFHEGVAAASSGHELVP